MSGKTVQKPRSWLGFNSVLVSAGAVFNYTQC